MDYGIGSWVTARAFRDGQRVALVDSDSGRRVSYAELDARTNALASALHTAGVRAGDRVALLALNSAEFMETLFAVAKLGAVTVPVNTRLSAAEVGYILSDSQACLLFVSSSLADTAKQAMGEAGHGVRRTVTIPVGAQRAAGERSEFEEFLATGSTAPIGPELGEHDLCALMYTSGTTGRPKGAMLTHGNMLWNAINLLTCGSSATKYDVTVTVAPLFHIGALGIFTLPLCYVGGTVVIQEAFVPPRTAALIADERATLMFLVPAMWAAMTQVPDLDDYDVSALRWAISGGAPCPLTVIEFFRGKGWNFTEGFGMTETAPISHTLEAEHLVTHAGSIGRQVRHVESRIVDEADREVAVDEVGELVLRGPNLFAGYWGLPKESAEAWRGGWFHTGDLGRVDADGFVTLVDRKKDMVITGGENVYPIEVEQVLYRHDAVAEVAVIGLPDEQWGETVVAVIACRDDATADAGELIAWARERLAHFKCPRRVEFVDVLPRNATGKLLKRELRRIYGGGEHAVGR
jgi:fatty-acyl-CoA synthase